MHACAAWQTRRARGTVVRGLLVARALLVRRPEMEAHTDAIRRPGRAPASTRPVPRTVLLIGLCLGMLTGGALWALRPDACSELCSVHGFLAATLGLGIGLYVALGRQEGVPAAISFAMSFGAGVILIALAVSAARISTFGDEIMLEPIVRALGDALVRPA
jgi:hypothetical protein